MARNVMPRTRLRQAVRSAQAPDRFFDFRSCGPKTPVPGVYRRLGRLFHPGSGRTVIMPLDHGVGEGMLPGLEGVGRLLELSFERDIQGVVLNKGPARAYGAAVPLGASLVVQLSGGTKHAIPPYGRTLVCSVGEALRLGADAVSVQINIGNDQEERMLADFGQAAEEARLAGLPMLAVIAPRGGQIVNELDPSLISHCIRLGSELGADLTGVPYSGDPASFAEAVEASDSPVLVTGGPGRADQARFLQAMDEALRCGAAGMCVGRSIFQSPDPGALLDQLLDLVHTLREESPEDISDDGVGDDPEDAPAGEEGGEAGL